MEELIWGETEESQIEVYLLRWRQNQLHSNDEVEMAVQLSLVNVTAMAEFLRLCQDGTNTLVCLGVMLKNNDISVY